MNIHHLLCFLFLLTSTTISAQTNVEPCGTELSTKQINWLKEFRQNPISYQKAADESVYLPIQFHILGSGYPDKPYGFFPAKEVYRVLCELNDDFSDTGMQFYSTEDFNYIVKAGYYSQFEISQGLEMIGIHNFPGVINVYIVGKAGGLCGYFAPFQDGIVVIKSCVEPGDNTLAHEIGHYFSLPHPFLGWENGQTPPEYLQERVNGSNCATSGDFFCDTRADYVSQRWNCPYSGKPLTDVDGLAIDPDETLFMSYSYDHCSTRFSGEQSEAMLGYLYQNRPYLLEDMPAEVVQMDSNLLLYPESPNTPVPFENILLAWSAVEGATEYYVEVRNDNLLPNFANFDAAFTTTETSAMLSLDPYITYNWSVQPLSTHIACTKASVGQFSTVRARTIHLEDFTMEVPQCHGEQGGKLEIVVAGGLAPFTYLWNDGSTEPFIENISSGTYSVVVTDAKGKENTLRFNVPEPDPIQIRLVQTAIDEAFADISGGTAPYDLQWSNGMNSEVIGGLETDVYELEVIDANGCKNTRSIQIVDFEVEKRNLSCYGTNDGSIAFTFNGETSDYQFSWNTGVTTSNIDELKPAVYRVRISDGDRVNIERNFTITNPEPLQGVLSIDDEGTVCVDVTGGTPPYTYMWPTGITETPCQSGLPDASLIPDPWKLNVVITDATECFLEFYPFEIPPPANGDKHAPSNNIAELSLENFQLFPNPALRSQSPHLQFELNTNSRVHTQVFNLGGQLMHENQGNYETGTHRQTLQIQDWQSGLYLVKLEVNGVIVVSRLVIGQ